MSRNQTLVMGLIVVVAGAAVGWVIGDAAAWCRHTKNHLNALDAYKVESRKIDNEHAARLKQLEDRVFYSPQAHE